eukprot:g4876.t1
MPDRATNTIVLSSGAKVFRPSVINCYPVKLSSISDWYEKWKDFMFVEKQADGKTGADRLQPIKRSKYPELSRDEELISLPLSTLCLAIFDAIELYIVEEVARDSWQDLRQQISTSLSVNKAVQTAKIIAGDPFHDRVVWFIQEAQISFAEVTMKRNEVLSSRFEVVVPKKQSRVNQNSLILLCKERFDVSSIEDVSEKAMDYLSRHSGVGQSVPVSDGDLLLIAVSTQESNERFLFCSFHGDTNGLASIPVVEAVVATRADLISSTGIEHTLVIGMDANVYNDNDPHFKPGVHTGIVEFGKAVVSQGLTTATGDVPDSTLITSMIARTFLQPQLSKANVEDIHPKDHFLFHKDRFPKTKGMTRCNTGGKHFDSTVRLLPTLTFPSDHCIVLVDLEG